MKRLYFSLLLVAVSSCHVTPDYEKPGTAKSIETATLQTDNNQRLKNAEPVVQWWQEFDDPLLVQLVEQALSSNNDIRVSLARVLEARALLGETRLDRLPTVEAGAGYARQRLSEAGVAGAVADRTINNYDAGFDAFWELDLFGQVQRRIEGAVARNEAADAALDATYVTVAAETARAYLDLRGAQYALNVARRNSRNQTETVRIITSRRDGGRASELDLIRATTQAQLTEATIPPIRARVDVAINRLSVLTATGSATLSEQLRETKPLPSLPMWVNIGDARSLLQRRADIRQVERELAIATADYGVAIASLYPSVSLVGSLGFQSVSASDFGSDASGLFSIGPSIRWPAFNLGRVRAQIQQSDARAQAALANFEQRVLVALEEVQSALANFSREEDRRLALYKAARSASEAARLARVRFDQGRDDFLDVLDAERVLLSAENQLAISETTVATNLIALYKALGGGWQVTQGS